MNTNVLLTSLLNAVVLALAYAIGGANGLLTYAMVVGVVGLRPYLTYKR